MHYDYYLKVTGAEKVLILRVKWFLERFQTKSELIEKEELMKQIEKIYSRDEEGGHNDNGNDTATNNNDNSTSNENSNDNNSNDNDSSDILFPSNTKLLLTGDNIGGNLFDDGNHSNIDDHSLFHDIPYTNLNDIISVHQKEKKSILPRGLLSNSANNINPLVSSNPLSENNPNNPLMANNPQVANNPPVVNNPLTANNPLVVNTPPLSTNNPQTANYPLNVNNPLAVTIPLVTNNPLTANNLFIPSIPSAVSIIPTNIPSNSIIPIDSSSIPSTKTNNESSSINNDSQQLGRAVSEMSKYMNFNCKPV